MKFTTPQEPLQRQAVREALRKLPKRERRLIELRFGLDGEPHSLEGVGHELSITRERVRQLEHDALARLKDELAGPRTDEPNPTSDDFAKAA